MPSIESIVEGLRPVIDEAINKAALAERQFTLKEVKRFAARAESAEEVAEWCALNLQLIDAAEEGKAA